MTPQGTRHAVLGSRDPVSMALSWTLDSPVSDIDSPLAAGLHGVVIVTGVDPFPEPVETRTLDERAWRRLTDRPLRRTLGALQRARASMRERGGRIVIVLPTIGLTGAPGLVPYTTALEGIRAMAKSAARQWSHAGIGVNMVAPPISLFTQRATDFGDHLTPAAAPDGGTLIETVTETVVFLLRPDVHHIVGSTFLADGGSVMLP